jgi:hypothetical protein
LLFLTSFSAFSQYSQLQPGDTTKAKYPYSFPILGDKVFEKGFDIPYPWGGMLNFFNATQDIVIPDISVGFSDGVLPEIPLTNITNFVEFGKVYAVATSVNVRPDLWVLPFLNVYGIFGKTWAQTEVEMTYPIELKAKADLEGTSAGVGITGAGGLGKYFFVLDGNWVWTAMSNFEDPVRTGVFSFRLGRAFKFNQKPQSNIALWAGGMRVEMGGVTEGTVTLGEVIPPETWDRRDEIVNQYWDWYDGLSFLEKAVADQWITPIINKIEAGDGSGTVSYRLTKEPKQKWNMIIGGQYQLNKNHQFRVEGGILGNRKSLLLSYNYRFGFKRNR